VIEGGSEPLAVSPGDILHERIAKVGDEKPARYNNPGLRHVLLQPSSLFFIQL
jgi:hypothetical protein